MTILNQASDGLPNVMLVIYDVLSRSNHPIEKETLLEIVAPKGVIHEDGKQARQTLKSWLDLGLFVQTDNGIHLANRFDSPPESDLELLTRVRKAACACVLDPINNADLWATEKTKAADFTRSIAWVLAQDVYRSLYPELETLERAQLIDGTPPLMQNNTRRNGLKAWGQFLGFLRPVLKSAIEVDPTIAIRDVLPDLMESGEALPVTNFLEQLAHKLPVLDGGVWRRSVEERLRPNAFPTKSVGQLSTSLSRALLNLMRNEEIFLENRSDTGSGVVFTGQSGVRTDLRFTWIRRPENRKLS
jgi:hypothetical protein